MSKVTVEWVDDWQQARDKHPDQPVVIVLVREASHGLYMRYHGEFYLIDSGSYSLVAGQLQWCIAGIWFNPDSVLWMIDNSVAYPFTREDLVLYQLTWGDVRE